MNKIVITKLMDKQVSVLVSPKRVLEYQFEDDDSFIGNIYIGKVKQIVKNINAAFIDFEHGKTGYLSLSEAEHICYTSPHEHKKLCQGDEILVQIEKDGIKTKDPVLTTNLNFPGTYVVLTSAKHHIGFSSKIKDLAWKEAMKEQLHELFQIPVGIIIRTNAYEVPMEQVVCEIKQLYDRFQGILTQGKFRNPYTCMLKAKPYYLTMIEHCPSHLLSEIITDDPLVFEELKSRQLHVSYYEDKLITLDKLYSLEHNLNLGIKKHVWLDSGGYLVIEPTEAMVVVDVNTGKYVGKKSKEDAILKVNLEAAKEIAYQLRLRNLSGIIIVDFIDMKSDENKKRLLDELRKEVLHDSMKTTVLGMTNLGLVEITRKKGRKPIYNYIK